MKWIDIFRAEKIVTRDHSIITKHMMGGGRGRFCHELLQKFRGWERGGWGGHSPFVM